MIVSPAELADLEDAAAIAHNRANPDKARDFDDFVAAQRAPARFYKDDPPGTEQVIDSINLVIDGDPVVVSVEHIGR